MIIIFAGSGASKAVDPSKYPTTIEFFEKLPDSVKDNPIFNEICTHLKTEHGNETPDIEEILFILSELKDDLEKGKNKGTFFGWLITRNLLRSLAAHNFDTGLSPQMADDFIGRIGRLVDEINVLVYSFYGTEPTTTSLNGTWHKLLKGFRDTDPESPLEIFTTNYDLVLESALRSFDHKNTNIVDGRKKTHILETLDLKSWQMNRSSQYMAEYRSNKIRLTKLHGSIDWTCEDGEKIHTASLGFRGDHNKHVILYPGFKGEPDIEPFKSFHKYFRSCLIEAKFILFIGFAFRDNHINDLLERNTPPETPIHIIDIKKNLPDIPFANNPLTTTTTGFSSKGINEFFSSLTPTKE